MGLKFRLEIQYGTHHSITGLLTSHQYHTIKVLEVPRTWAKTWLSVAMQFTTRRKRTLTRRCEQHTKYRYSEIKSKIHLKTISAQNQLAYQTKFPKPSYCI